MYGIQTQADTTPSFYINLNKQSIKHVKLPVYPEVSYLKEISLEMACGTWSVSVWIIIKSINELINLFIYNNFICNNQYYKIKKNIYKAIKEI